MKTLTRWICAAAAAATVVAACQPDDEVGCGIPTTTLSSSGGEYTEAEYRSVSITLAADRPATIYFTLDGTPPKLETANCKNGPTFCGESPVSAIPFVYDGMTLQYFAVDSCGNQERPKTSVLRIDRAPTTVADPLPGLFSTPITVTLTATDESDDVSAPTIYWTTDGSSPDPTNPAANSAAGSATIPLQNSTALKWFAVDANGNQEAEKTGQYTIDTLPPKSEANPESGFYDSPLNVTLRIVNDTGTLYYSSNGAIPDKNDANGHTKTASLQTTLTLAESTFLRFTSVDKAANAEHKAGEFNEVTYILDDLPAVIATPPGGTYGDTALTITLKGAPASDTNLFRAIDGGAEVPYTGPFTISGNDGGEVVVTIRAQRTGQIESVVKTETYVLGSAGETETFVESFANTNFIDTDVSTAQIDTTAQKAVIPNFSFAELGLTTNLIGGGNVQPGDQFGWTKATLYNPAVRSRTVAAVDGLFFGVNNTGETGVGIKFYTWPNDAGNDLEPNLSFAGRWFVPDPAQPDLILAADLFLAGLTVPAAVVATLGDTLAFLNIDDPANPTTLAVVDGFEFSRGGQAALLAQYNDAAENYVFATRHSGDAGGPNAIVAFQVGGAPGAAIVAGQVTLSTTTAGLNRDIVALAFDPTSLTNDRLLALTLNCELWRVDFANVASPVTNLVSTTICPSGTQARALLAADVDAISNVAYVAYTGNNVASVDLGVDGVSIIGTIRRNILGSNTPTDDIWRMQLLFNAPFSSERTLAVAAGSAGIRLYDAANLTATLLPPVEQRVAAGFEIDGLTHYENPDGDEIVIGGLRDATVPDFRGGLATYKAVGAPATVFVQSEDINTSGRNVKTVKIAGISPTDAVLYFSTDGGSFDIGPVTNGQVTTLMPPAASLYWRSTLFITGVTELDNINLQLSLE